jgi:DNA-directed RNA polymerase subunit beta'
MPSQDMVLGCYYLTTINSKIQPTPNLYFANLNDVYKAYLVKQIFPHDFIWLPWKKPFYSTQLNGDILEIRLRYNRKKSYLSEKLIVNSTNYKTYFLQHLKNQDRLNGEAFLKDQFLRTTVGRVILNYEFQNTMNSSNVKFVNLNNSK